MTKYYVYINIFGGKYIKKARFYSNLAQKYYFLFNLVRIKSIL